MPVSAKMINTCMETWAKYTKFQRSHREITQAVVDAAWTQFDPEDPNTWPKRGFAPSGLNWLVRRESPSYGETPFANLLPYFNNTHGKWIAMRVTHYADPADFLPSSLSVNKNGM